MDVNLVNDLQNLIKEDSQEPEEVLFKNNPSLPRGGLVHQAHMPENVILVWWFNPSTAEFIASKDKKHLHMDDYRDKPYLLTDKGWVRGRVFGSDGKIFLLIYNLKGMSDLARMDLIIKASEAIEPVTISTVVTPEGEDISNLFEGTSCVLTPAKSGHWEAIKGTLVEVI